MMWQRLRRWVQDIPIHDPIERRQALLVQVILLGLCGILLFSALLTLVAYPFTTGINAAANLRNSVNNFQGALFVIAPLVLLRRGFFRVAVVVLMIELLLLAFTTLYSMGLEVGWGALEFALPISLAALALGRRWLLMVYVASIAGVAVTAFVWYPLAGMPRNAPSAIIAFALIAGLLALFLDRFGTAFRESLAAQQRLNDELEQRVTERTRQLAKTNHELEQANQTKDRFLASMSHELRTPLNGIIGFTGTLLMKLPGPLTVDQEKQLRTVQGSAKHLLSLINDILDLAKIESGTVELSLEPVVCQEVIAEVAAGLRPLAETKALTLEITLPDHPIVVQADRRALSQILINLVNNAIKFTEQGSVRLTLSQRHESGQLRTEIGVADTGRGIHPEDQAKLFQAFSQVVTSGTRRQEGTGLGLYLSQKLAQLLGGQITVASEYGSGSTFILSFPDE
jgi:signal transduction histidine kinase